MQVFAGQWLLPPENPADLNGDDIVNMDDFSLLANNWSTTGISLAINEFMASDNSIIQDPQGQYDDWVQRQYIRVDRVGYSDGSHPEDCPGNVDLWPVEADGGGQSLTRSVLSDYGNDPDNWVAANPKLAE
jgi:hypothetical protein